jgi:hypothetical protein
MTNKEFLESQASYLTDKVSILCKKNCGGCHKIKLGAIIARNLLNGPEWVGEGLPRYWSELLDRAWKRSKYYRFYVSEQEAGRDAEESFKARGWQL